MPYDFYHAQLGRIRGSRVTPDLVQLRSLPYARIPSRFARSTLFDYLPTKSTEGNSYYDATEYGPCSIQPLDSVETDLRWNQLPEYPTRDQFQDENCLSLTLTIPAIQGADTLAYLPVIVFIHGGALMIGSGLSYTKAQGL